MASAIGESARPGWRASACILCECNCGIEILPGADSRSFGKIRGDKRHPASRGYTCNKAWHKHVPANIEISGGL